MLKNASCGNDFSSIFQSSFLFVSDQACDLVWIRSTMFWKMISFWAHLHILQMLAPMMPYLLCPTSRLPFRLEKISTEMVLWYFGGREQMSYTLTQCTWDNMCTHRLLAATGRCGADSNLTSLSLAKLFLLILLVALACRMNFIFLIT